MKEKLREFYMNQRGNVPVSELVGVAVGGTLGFLALPVAEWIIASFDWSDYFKFILHRASQSFEIKLGVGVFGAAAGLFIGSFQRQEKIREQQERNFWGRERGSVRVTAVLTTGALAAGIGAGVLAAHGTEPVVNASS